MQLFHIPQWTIHNRNVHISVLNYALWAIEYVKCGNREIGLLAFVGDGNMSILPHGLIPQWWLARDPGQTVQIHFRQIDYGRVINVVTSAMGAKGASDSQRSEHPKKSQSMKEFELALCPVASTRWHVQMSPPFKMSSWRRIYKFCHTL